MNARALALFPVLMIFIGGCGSSDYNGHGIIYGCDGSGAGVILRWGPSANRGLRKAGYEGIIKPFSWQTGLGVVADHMSNNEYKRSAAKGLARQIVEHRSEYPEDPVYVAGLSAGCAVVIYALEELTQSAAVEQVFLLSSSVSASCDLSRALQCVRGKVYAFTSQHDAVLQGLVTQVGTADRVTAGASISGLIGFRSPPGASAAVRQAYSTKVHNIAWRPEFAAYGHHGGHTDCVATDFIAEYVAPLMVPARGGSPTDTN